MCYDWEKDRIIGSLRSDPSVNILVVDDELIIRKGLEKAIRQFDGYRVAGTADDGESALEWLHNAKQLPDLMITDIFMQFMDGLELIEKVNRLYPQIKCAILSGHEDFQLARKAIDLKVARYITKPVEAQQLQDILDEIHKELIMERAYHKQPARSQRHEANAALYVRDKLLSDLLEGRLVSALELEEFAAYFPFALEDQLISGIISIRKNGMDLLQRDMLLYGVAVKQLFFETVLQQNKGFVMIKDTETLVFAFVKNNFANMKALKEFPALSEDTLGVPIVMDWQDTGQGLLQLQRFVVKSMESLDSRIGDPFIYPFDLEEKLRLSLRSGNSKEAEGVAMEFIRRLMKKNNGKEPILQGFYKLIHSLESLFGELDIPCPEPPHLIQLSLSASANQMKNWLGACIDIKEKRSSRQSCDSVDKVTAYMQEHYGDYTLTLMQLAELAAVHPNYLTQMFRKRTGFSCMQYLARLRMEKAKELLNKTDLKISEIAERVGYENPLYFSSYFKKWVGLNPSEYKDSQGTYA